MNEKDFLEEYNGAPYELSELASIAATANGELGKKAKAFEEAQNEFESYLDSIDYEWG